MESDDIHLVKAAFLKQFIIAMDRNGVSSELYLKKVGLPDTELEPESLLPVKPFYQLINIIAVNENIPDFGSQVALTTPWHKVPPLIPLIQNSKDLKSLLNTFCDVASNQSSSVIFALRDEGSHYSFSYTNTLLYKGDVQMELYRITSMIQLVHLATGAQWRPDAIRLNMPMYDAIKASPLITKSIIYFSQAESAISIPTDLLKLPVHLDNPDKIKIDMKQENLDIQFANSIRQIMNAYVYNHHCTIDEIAKIAGISVRTLQRRLKQYNLNFNDLLNQAKFITAKEKLNDTEIHINEIAKKLGYSDAANFSRAFHRWAGVSPSEYREQ